MYFKALMIFFLSSCYTLSYADSYRLLVDNNTNDHFTVEVPGEKPMTDLESQQKDKLYEVDWETNAIGTTTFLIRFYIPNQGSYEVFASALKEDDPRLRCTSRFYECQVMVHDDNEGKLTINYRDED